MAALRTRTPALLLAVTLAVALGVVLGVALARPALADDLIPGDFGAAAKALTEAMTRDLGLSVIQVPEVGKANDAAAALLQQAAAGLNSADKGARRDAMRAALRAFGARESDLRAILTPDQWQRFSADRAERAADLQTRLMEASLKLNDAQAEQVRLLNLENAGRMREALGPLQVAVTRDARYQAEREILAIQDDREVSLKAILTKDQWKAYKEHREEMRSLVREMRQGG